MALIDIPLSLQDMCMLRILLQIKDFPVHSLVLLPREIRRKLLYGLSHADVLHLADTKLFDYADSNRDYPYISHVRQCFLDLVLHLPAGYMYKYCLCRFFSIHLKTVLKWFSHKEYRCDSNAERNLFDHICKCYPSLEPTKIHTNFKYYFLVPNGSLAFVQLPTKGTVFQKVDFCDAVLLALPLLNYCNMHSAPTELTIDCYDLRSTEIWKEVNEVVETAKRHDSKVDLVIPFLQEFLSTVEVLELGTVKIPDTVDGLEGDMHTVPYVILYNILSSREPRLKHVKIYGIPVFVKWALETLVELINATSTPAESIFTAYRSVEVLSPLSTPYLLEGISVLLDKLRIGYYAFQYMLTSFASSISRNVMSVLETHKEKLRSVSVDDLGYCYDFDNLNVSQLEHRADHHICSKRNINVPSYTSLLLTFVQFVKQPSFTDLRVGKSPLPEAYELIKAFLFTPAAHKQSLRIEASSERSVPEMEELKDEETMKIGSTLKEDSRKRESTTELSEAPSQKIMKLYSPAESSSSFQINLFQIAMSNTSVLIWGFLLAVSIPGCSLFLS